MAPEAWKRNLYVIFIAELIVIIGFSFVTPFIPLFIQKVGGLETGDAAFWSGIANSAAGVAMFLSSPVWGIMADRWGRKPMVLRAMFGGGVVLAITGMAPNVYAIVGLRFLQGALSGTVAAASALVAANTPRDKLPFAMGLLMMAVFTGNTVGPLIGGFAADTVGYRGAFWITGGLLLSGALIVLFLVKEQFERPVKGQAASLGSVIQLARSKEMYPLLIVQFALQAGPAMMSPIISLSIKEFDPLGAAATLSGIGYSCMGIVAAVSSFVAGRLSQRFPLKQILVFCCIGTSFLYLPPIWAATVIQFLGFIALMGLLKGGIITSTNALIGLTAPENAKGIAYGLSQSASSLGSGIGPLVGGSLATVMGLRPVFAVAGGVYLIVGIAISTLLVGVSLAKKEAGSN